MNLIESSDLSFMPQQARLFQVSDVLWLEPIGRKYGEYESILELLDKSLLALVHPPLALMFLVKDEHGLRLVFLTDTPGIKALIRLSRFIYHCAHAHGYAPYVHLHFDGERGWQEDLAQRFGCQETEPRTFFYRTEN